MEGTVLEEIGFPTFCSQTFSCGLSSALYLDGEEVTNVYHIDCSSSVVFTRWWRLGILPLAEVTAVVVPSRTERKRPV